MRHLYHPTPAYTMTPKHQSILVALHGAHLYLAKHMMFRNCVMLLTKYCAN